MLGSHRPSRALYRPPGRVYNTIRVALDWSGLLGGTARGLRLPKESTVIEVFVESIRVNMTNYRRVVMLKEKTGQRYLPIWIGHFEADAIAIPMQNVPVTRPLTHDLLGSVISSLGGKVTQVIINELAEETFFAKLVVDANGRHVEVDSRPSDAIALAIRAKVPIFVEDSVLDQAGMVFESEGDKDESDAEPKAVPAETIDESKLGVFRDFIETLDFEDLGRGGSERPERQ
jgi:uncharacterized protein